jgi:hypothetical protein
MVEVSDPASSTVHISGADQLPKPVISVVAYQKDGCTALKDLRGLRIRIRMSTGR